MKIFRTGSSAVVVECQKQFNFLPLKFQVDIRTADFMTKFMSADNFVCRLFVSKASRNLNTIFSKLQYIRQAYVQVICLSSFAQFIFFFF